MEITSDILLRGTCWNKAIDELSCIFTNKTHYSIFVLCLSIGIMYDKRIEKPIDNGEDTRSVPRNVIGNNDNGKLDFYFQASILSTCTERLTENERLELAFGDKCDFNKISYLVQFANYGVTKLVELIGITPLESMENIKKFFESTIDGRNLDIDALPDDILLIDDLNL
ncbi:hypothetical protein [Clostridium taeniosporum]|uniref:Uncharacterized protein n=1 Tax=Clostridium taeniosporum TaxID=394958 RepID=A0A1D7XKA3_9CLOT|nr:hypothetical protein [Clostridium taeniosporum]AOR23766.1 hypothetical protein BGI42_08510 [Clostridium taeniosporum]